MDKMEEEINQLALSDTRLLAIRISLEETSVLKITLTIELHYRGNEKVELHFDNVREYSFYNKSDCYQYHIVDYKFMRVDDLYYISLDPVDISGSPNEEDNDFIYAEKATIRYIK